MLQVFHMDAVKVDQDVAYVAMAIHICCKRLFQMFHLFFQTYVISVFIWMLYMFHIYVAYVFVMAFQVFLVFFFKCFRRMIQVFHLSDVYCKCSIWMFQK